MSTQTDIENLLAENARLKLDVERLTEVCRANQSTVDIYKSERDVSLDKIERLRNALSECITEDGAHCLAKSMSAATLLKTRVAAINATARQALKAQS